MPRRTNNQKATVKILNAYGNPETITITAKSNPGMASKIRRYEEEGKLIEVIRRF